MIARANSQILKALVLAAFFYSIKSQQVSLVTGVLVKFQLQLQTKHPEPGYCELPMDLFFFKKKATRESKKSEYK
jgi:hypothetical protein